MKNITDITTDLVGLLKDIYHQGVEDGLASHPISEDAFIRDARAQIGEILDSLGNAERLDEIIQAESEGRLLILKKETSESPALERALLHVSRQLAIKRKLVEDYEAVGYAAPVIIALRREMERIEVTLKALCEMYERETERGNA